MSTSQPLSNFKLWELEQADAIQDRISKLYNDTNARFEPAKGNRLLRGSMYAVPLGGISLNSMAFPDGVHASAPQLLGAIDFCTAAQGSASMKIGRTEFGFDPNTGAILSPYQTLDVNSPHGYVSLNVSIPRFLIEAQLSAITGKDHIEQLLFEPSINQSKTEIANVWRFVNFAVEELERTTSAIHYPLVAEQLSESILTGFLYAQPHNHSNLLRLNIRSHEPRYVRQVEEYIHAHCDTAVKAVDMAALTGISVSALYAGFRRFRGYTPMQFLQKTRLNRVRLELLVAGPEAKVSDIAGRWGFAHLGRFSKTYAERYGELPSETLRQSNRR